MGSGDGNGPQTRAVLHVTVILMHAAGYQSGERIIIILILMEKIGYYIWKQKNDSIELGLLFSGAGRDRTRGHNAAHIQMVTHCTYSTASN